MCNDHDDSKPFDQETRRSILKILGISSVGTIAASAAAQAKVLPGMQLAPTAGADLLKDAQAHGLPKPLIATANDILGPFWRAGAPFQADIVPKGATGQRLTIAGRVLDTSGRPIPGVIMDFWNADAAGKYDLDNPFQHLMPDGYRYRGLVKSADDGTYSVETIVPGKYRVPPQLPGFETFNGLLRPAHVHLMTSHNGTVPLITQIYFKDDKEIAADPWASKSQNVAVIDQTAPKWRSQFDVVLVRAST